jgi:hypothetical protein
MQARSDEIQDLSGGRDSEADTAALPRCEIRDLGCVQLAQKRHLLYF